VSRSRNTPGSDRHAIQASIAMSKVARSIRNLELPLGLTPERLSALATVGDKGPVTITQLAEIEGVGLSTVSRIVAALEANALVKRRGSKTDGRSASISMTAKGKRILEQGIQESLYRLNDVLSSLDEDLRNSLVDMIIDIRNLDERS